MSLVVRPPSLQGRFSLVYSGDPALQPRPEDLPESSPERDAMQSRYDHEIGLCRDSGNWATMTVPGSVPTVFSFEIPRGEARRRLIDSFRTLLAAGKDSTAASVLVRATLRDVANWPGPKLTWIDHDGSRVLADDVIDFLDDISPKIVSEMAGHVRDRLIEMISGK